MIERVRRNTVQFQSRVAIVIDRQEFTYLEVGERVAGIRSLLNSLALGRNETVGVVTYNDIDTYATIWALWFEGLCFLPLNPRFPASRIHSIVEQTGVRCCLSSRADEAFLPPHFFSTIHRTAGLKSENIATELPATFSDNDLMYILFTSGSTGAPKGVPINRRNLQAFVDGFFANGYSLDENDRFLQMFDFSFDISVQCYVLPFCIGASLYTVPLDDVKLFSIYQILESYKITIAKMVPSAVALLRPYFPKIKLPHLRYSLFSGEALQGRLMEEWSHCVPNATIQNYYGPTEATIDCTYYTWLRGGTNKVYNGTVSIGKPFGDTQAVILNESNVPIDKPNLKGELCVAGSQVTTSYVNLPDRDSVAFITLRIGQNEHSFYRTGDIAFFDDDGDLMYCGRLDHQVQLQGHRVELGEIESFAMSYLGTNKQAVAVTKELENGNVHLFLFVEKSHAETSEIVAHLQQALPYYMQPTKIIQLDNLPLNRNGKIDRNQLKEMAI